MTTITVPINKEIEDFINEELSAGTAESKAHLVRVALMRLREERALARLEEAERDIREGRVYKGNLSKILRSL